MPDSLVHGYRVKAAASQRHSWEGKQLEEALFKESSQFQEQDL